MSKGRKSGTSASDAPPQEPDLDSRGRRVQVALDEIVASAQEGLLAVAVGAGLQVMQALMEDDVTAVCGPKGRHDPDRIATRWGHESGSVNWAAGGCRSRAPGAARHRGPASCRCRPMKSSPELR